MLAGLNGTKFNNHLKEHWKQVRSVIESTGPWSTGQRSVGTY